MRTLSRSHSARSLSWPRSGSPSSCARRAGATSMPSRAVQPCADGAGRHQPLDWLAQRLSRVTSTGTLIPEVDGLRFIAISAVVCHHLLGIFLSDTGRSRSLRAPEDWLAVAHHSWLVIAAYV